MRSILGRTGGDVWRVLCVVSLPAPPLSCFCGSVHPLLIMPGVAGKGKKKEAS
jgi:hypothetical protein